MFVVRIYRVQFFYFFLRCKWKNGLGQTVAVLFAKKGAKVAIASRDVAGLKETKQICAAYVKDPNTDVCSFT